MTFAAITVAMACATIEIARILFSVEARAARRALLAILRHGEGGRRSRKSGIEASRENPVLEHKRKERVESHR